MSSYMIVISITQAIQDSLVKAGCSLYEMPDRFDIDTACIGNPKWPSHSSTAQVVLGDELQIVVSVENGIISCRPKDTTPNEAIEDIRPLYATENSLRFPIADQVSLRFCRQQQRSTHEEPKKEPILSQREKVVLEYIAKGFKSDEIADLMSISRHTVLTFVRRIFNKLEVKSRVEAVYEARNWGLISN